MITALASRTELERESVTQPPQMELGIQPALDRVCKPLERAELSMETHPVNKTFVNREFMATIRLSSMRGVCAAA